MNSQELLVNSTFSFQSDFPYAPAPAYPAFLEELETIEMDQGLRDKINFGNARALIPRLNKS